MELVTDELRATMIGEKHMISALASYSLKFPIAVSIFPFGN